MRASPFLLRALLALLTAAPAACGYRPARFADAPAVTAIGDDAPIPVPKHRYPVKEIYYVEAYVHRPAALALDPARPASAGDVNALDEVPRSSWFDPTRAPNEGAMGPPLPPFAVVPAAPESGQGGLAIRDVRGVRYELLRDSHTRPEVRTASAAISARLLNAVGWRAPEVHVVNLARSQLQHQSRAGALALEVFLRGPVPLATAPGSAGGAPAAVEDPLRVRAMRWPMGIDLGPTPVTGTRDADPNDRVPHTERRTLRALKLALFWIGASQLDPNALRDAYQGSPGQGHLLHWMVGLDSALGGGAIDDVENARLGGEGRRFDANALTAFVSLGLALRYPPALQTRWPGLGDYEAQVSLDDFSPQPPFEPFDRMLPADAYWAAKRIASVPSALLRDAIAAGKMGDPASAARALVVLEARRATILASALAAVTPLEIEAVDAGHLTLRDEAIARGRGPLASTTYAIAYLDADGNEVAPALHLRAKAAQIRLPLPLPGQDYLVVQVRVLRGGVAAARACEIHLVRDRDGARILGLRH